MGDFSTADTIVAVATPPGRGGLGVVRVSGPEAQRVAATLLGRTSPFVPRHATVGRLRAPGLGAAIDEVVVTVFPGPRSYTGEDVAEISAHGSPVVLEAIVAGAVAAGARMAGPGEFTLRGFLHGKRDLVQSEAVADLIEAVTPLQARAAFDQLQGTLTGALARVEAPLFDLVARLEASLDFPDEGFHFITRDEVSRGLDAAVAQMDTLLAGAARGQLVRDGALVVLVGAPNVGKSSLFNALLNTERAIVTPTPGTTRDLVSERLSLEGLLVSLVDTAGLRETDDVVEREGVSRSAGALAAAELAVVVLDASRARSGEDDEVLRRTHGRPRVVVINKCDRPPAWHDRPWSDDVVVAVSARTGEGLDTLAATLRSALMGDESARETPALTNIRHITLLREARSALVRARVAADDMPEEFLLADIHESLERLQAVTGRRTADDVLRHIFERFCIGK